jgi:hypothetical protein
MANEFVPEFIGLLNIYVVVLVVEGHIILDNLRVEFIYAKHLGDLHEELVVVHGLEEGLLLEDHA